MIARNMTQAALAKALGVSQPTISDWLSDNEKIKREPTLENLVKVAEILGMPPARIAFDDEFEPMDDAERAVVESFRKMSDLERKALSDMVTAFTFAREFARKPGKRTPKTSGVPVELLEDAKASPTSVSPSHAIVEFVRQLPEVSEVQKAQAGLLEHLSVLPIGTKAWNACEIPATLLRRLVATLRSIPQTVPHTDSPASSSGATPASATKPPDRVPSDQPLPFPPEPD